MRAGHGMHGALDFQAFGEFDQPPRRAGHAGRQFARLDHLQVVEAEAVARRWDKQPVGFMDRRRQNRAEALAPLIAFALPLWVCTMYMAPSTCMPL